VPGSFYTARGVGRKRKVLLLILQKASTGLQKTSNLETSPDLDCSFETLSSAQWAMDQVAQGKGG
jgi:hypothetical protein